MQYTTSSIHDKNADLDLTRVIKVKKIEQKHDTTFLKYILLYYMSKCQV